MEIFIHRGAEEIGGNAIEVKAQGKSILLDLGAPLMGDVYGEKALPAVKGLKEGDNPDLLGILISHPHADHYGLTIYAHPSIPVYIGKEANTLLKAALAFGPFGADFEKVSHYSHREPFKVGPFKITPFLADHSAFDAYSFIIEADGKSIFYSGDLRGHGWKKGIFEELLSNPPKNVDAMLLEGTTLGRERDEPIESEADLVPKLIRSFKETEGIILASFSGQNIDRFVTFFKAALSTKRTMIVDIYIAQLLKALGRASLPDPTKGQLRVFLPKRMKYKIVRDKSFDLVKPFYSQRIYPEEINNSPERFVMTFRASMAQDLEDADCLKGGRLIYSLWPGYLERSSPDLRDWCSKHQMTFEIIHTSGHASKEDLQRLVTAIGPKILIPIHTLSHKTYEDLHNHVLIVPNKEWFKV